MAAIFFDYWNGLKSKGTPPPVGKRPVKAAKTSEQKGAQKGNGKS